MTTGHNLPGWQSGVHSESSLLVCEMSIQVYRQYGSTPRRRAPHRPGGGANPSTTREVISGPPAWLRGRRAYAHNGTAEGLALSLSLVRL
jgi:hypothetical protein